MTFPFVDFLKLCNCMISQGECLTWCDRQTALGPENRDWQKKQANPCDLFCSFAPASPLCWDNSGSLSLNLSFSYLEMGSYSVQHHSPGREPVGLLALSPCSPPLPPASLYLLTVSASAHTFSSCPQVPLALLSTVWIPYSVTFCKQAVFQ